MRPVISTIIFVCILSAFSAFPSTASTFEEAEAAVRRGDYVAAMRLFRPLAEEGDARSQVKVGVMYALGKGVRQDDGEALKWYRLAASQGDALGQFKVGVMYALGKGVKQNNAEAVKWYRMAAEQGNALAEALLGSAYAVGKGVSKNYAEAAKWFILAADQGHRDGQFTLGLMYALGRGVPQNYIAAHMWLSLAAAQGDEPAAIKRGEIARMMTPTQVAEAQRLASEWRPQAETTPPSHSNQKADTAVTSGTAFFVSSDGKMLTNAHVVEKCQQIRVAGAAARLLARDGVNDLALLASDLHPTQWAAWHQTLMLGEEIVAYGFPLAGVLSSSGNVVTGNVTALAGLGDDSRFLQISAPVQPGNSGGPLFDRYGNLVGVIVAKLNAVKIASATGDIPQNVNFAIKGSVAMAFLDSQRVTHPDGPTAQALSTPDIAARAQALAVQVVCMQ